MADNSKLNRINATRILQTIWQNKGISRIEISEQLHLDRSTVTKIVNNLLERNLVLSLDKKKAREPVGRKPVRLSINDEYGYVLGLELQTEICRVVVIDLHGQPILFRSYPFHSEKQNLEEMILQTIRTIMEEMATDGKHIIGAGIGLSGVINPYTGEIYRSYPLKVMNTYPLGRNLSKELPFPVLLENDANCCCWGELAFRKGKRDRNFLVVLGEFRRTNIESPHLTGVAVGLGLVIREKVLHGDNFTAGEFKSLEWKMPNSTQFSISDEESFRILDDKNVLNTVFEETAKNTALLANCLNCTRVIIAGGFSTYSQELKPLIHEAVQQNFLYATPHGIGIDFAAFGENSVAYGAAGYFVEKLFTAPTLTNLEQGPLGLELFDKIEELKDAAAEPVS